MTVTPKLRLIILILGITTNLNLGNILSSSAKNAEIQSNLILSQNFKLSDLYSISDEDSFVKLYFTETSKNETTLNSSLTS